MSQGLRIRNASGQLTLEVTDRLARFHSTLALTNIGPRATANFSIPGYSSDGSWFLYFRDGSTSYLRFAEIAGGLSVFNEDWYQARGAGVIIEILRG